MSNGNLSVKGGTPGMVRIVNRTLIYELVRDAGPISRADLARITRLTRASVSEVVEELLAAGLLREKGVEASGRVGRAPTLLELEPRSGLVVGVDIGGTTVSAWAADLAGTPLARVEWHSKDYPTRSLFLGQLEASIRRAVQQTGLDPERLKAVCVATPGIVDSEGNVLGASPNLPEWRDLPLAHLLRQVLRLPVVVENDVNAALVGEGWKGAGRRFRNIVFLAAGTGIGGALMIEGRLVRGAHSAAGEVGYLLFGRETLDGSWGEHGCFESLASGPAVASAARAQLQAGYPSSLRTLPLSQVDAPAVFAAARDGDGMAREIVAEVADYFALAVCNLAAVVDPECVIIGGGVSRSADLLLDRIRAAVSRHLPIRPVVEVAELGQEAGVWGAIRLAVQAAEAALLGPKGTGMG